MPLIAGLGNIGDKYQGTRHNIGFTLVDRLAGTLSATMENDHDVYVLGIGRFKGIKTLLIKPTTWMNNSGKAVLKACRKFHYLPNDILVCCDDIHLPVGKVRLRSQGGAGGHNGIQSVIDHLGTDQFPRLRFGIGSDFEPGQQSEYVLSVFNKDEKSMVDNGLSVAEEAVLCFLREGIASAMNNHNR